jgi:hypothetical protein
VWTIVGVAVIVAGCGSGTVSDGGGSTDAAESSSADASPSAPDGRVVADASPGAPDAAPRPDARTDGTCDSPDLGQRTAPAFPAPSVSTSGLLVRVMNNCDVPLWIHGEGSNGAGGRNVLAPDDVRLMPGQTQDYDGRDRMVSARVTAFRDGPRQNEAQFVELNFENGSLGYNISYVDYLGLPVELDAACGTTACYEPTDTLFDGCPADLRRADRCVAPGGYCLDPANRGKPMCTLLDSKATEALQLAQCQNDLAAWRGRVGTGEPIGTTPNVYNCSQFWSSSAFCCAIVNRGVVGSATPNNVCTFYQDGVPHNEYARWVHDKCPVIYAFPYDDSGDQGGFLQCPTRELRITWCPGD